MTVTTAIPARQENHAPGLVSAVNTPSLNKFLPVSNLKPGTHLKTSDGQAAVVVGGAVPADHDGWMWDLTVPGNNDHDFYVLPAQLGNQPAYHALAGTTPILVHNINTQCRVPAGLPGAGQFARDPGAAPQTYSRDSEYPSGFRQSTRATMAAQWQDPVTGEWLDEQGNVIPTGELTFDHVQPVVDHWNSEGYDMSRADRNDWYSEVFSVTFR